ncbi:uncharacterized protein LOC127247613 isoform X2 [Andrographis paniculata]|uniref:uncharacterized protein LOC127247613 isoform X2 n=1 Tax=Andrographis paniculata TaxID=175694 RepID=UPI0021E73DBB|nr:uncharacterized protein LOC127247613 isoform X2 [Andrographis paniculata]
MSTSRGSGAAAEPIPAGARKVVQSLKEIVNCSEVEIYAALKECSMDPNEAVNRLLSQDPFHEVKSKREKKKEGKDPPESRSRGATKNLSRGNKIGTDHYGGHGGSSSYNSSDLAPLPGKTPYKKEQGSIPHSGFSSSVPGMSANTRSRGSVGLSNGPPGEMKTSPWGTVDATPSSDEQPTSVHQSAWMGAPGQLSMADIVKMGRPHNKGLNASNALNGDYPVPSVTDHNLRFPDDHVGEAPESGISSMQYAPTSEDWPIDENPTASKVITAPAPAPEYTIDREQHLETSDALSGSVDEHFEEEEVQESDDGRLEVSGTHHVGSDFVYGRKILHDNSGGPPVFENDMHKNMGSYQHQTPEYNSDEEPGASVSAVAQNLQQLSVEEEYNDLPSSKCVPSVLIPDHLQVQDVDCSHLRFGTYRLDMNAAYSSGTRTSMPVKHDLEQPHADAGTSSVGHHETRSSEYFDDSHTNAADGRLFHRDSASAGSYVAAASKPEESQPEDIGVPRNDYHFLNSNSGYNFDDAQRLNAALSQTNSQMQNLTPFSNVMSYTDSLPSTLLLANIPPSRESDLQYSPFPGTQSTAAKYGNSVSSIGASVISMSEALKTAGSSSAQTAPHNLSATNVATGPPQQQHLTVHPSYSQHTLPLGPFANMIGYPLLPQSYAYMPSAFQQAFAGNNSYHQSLAALLPQYKGDVSAGSLPQSAAIPSGYGAFGNATIPGNFPINPANAPSGATPLNYEDVLNPQSKDISHLMALQQSENAAAMWLHGPNSRTMASPYYNYQQSGSLRQPQPQQAPHNYGALGYPNLYHSQQQVDDLQNPRDGLLGPSHGQPKQSQLWQNY